MPKKIWRAETSLFWFLPEGTELDLSIPASRDRVVQQVITRGTDQDVIRLLRTLTAEEFVDSFQRIKEFVPPPITKFWERYIADHHPTAASPAGTVV